MKNFLILILALFLAYTSFSQDIYGGEIYYKYIGQNKYEVTLVKYGKCTNNHFGTTQIKVKCGGQILDSKSVNPVGLAEVASVCDNQCTKCASPGCTQDFGYRKYTFKTTFDLSSYASCCDFYFFSEGDVRPATITTGLASKSFYVEAYLNKCIKPDNNSPKFSNEPIMLYNQSVDYYYTPGFYDLDKDENGVEDSVVFEMAQPKGQGGVNLSYGGQYSFDKPIYFWGFPNKNLNHPRGFHLNSEQGVLSFRPMNREETVVAIKLKEFYKGQLVGEITRDFYVKIDTQNMLNFAPFAEAALLNGSPANHFEVCVGEELKVYFYGYDYNPFDDVRLTYNSELANAIWEDKNNQTGQLKGVLTWTPKDIDVGKPFRYFSITAEDDHCPIPGKKTQSFSILVKPRPKVEVKITSIEYPGCGHVRFSAKLPFDTTVFWTGDVFKKVEDTAFNMEYKDSGTYYFSVLVPGRNGCNYFYESEIYTPYTGPKRWTKDLDTVCFGSGLYELEIFPKPQAGLPPGLWKGIAVETQNFKYYFNASDSSVQPNKFHRFIYMEPDSIGCWANDTLDIYVLKNKKPDVGDDLDACKDGNPVDLIAYPKGGKWSGTGIQGNKFIPSLDLGNYELIYRIDKNGLCPQFDTLIISVNPKPVASFGVDVNYGVLPLTVEFMDSSHIDTGNIAEYIWNFGDGDTSHQKGNVKHTYDTDGDFSVILLVSSDKGCSNFLSKTSLIDVWTVGLSEVSKNEIKIYPNPFDDIVRFSEQLNDIFVYDVQGKLLWQKRSVDAHFINLGFLCPGIYIIEITDKHGDTQKILLKKK
jgi:hypothetical protein